MIVHVFFEPRGLRTAKDHSEWSENLVEEVLKLRPR